MASQFEYSTFVHTEELQQLGYILEQCFVMRAGESERYINRIGSENFRIIYRDKQVVGGLGIISMGQWWGGERVPMTGISAVGIAPEYRGGRAAIALMQHTLQELYNQGVPISVLYPATQRLYRKAGYEQAGSFCIWEINSQSIQLREQPLTLQSVIASNHEIFHNLYQQQAKVTICSLQENSMLHKQLFLKPRKYSQVILLGWLITFNLGNWEWGMRNGELGIGHRALGMGN
ncbi:GNAT family N-acetyltransferase [Nostoc sp. UHCC 0702]|nr:GNAT family N-acetyltransferase [Nostoc sp. UHCC 0702]